MSVEILGARPLQPASRTLADSTTPTYHCEHEFIRQVQNQGKKEKQIKNDQKGETLKKKEQQNKNKLTLKKRTKKNIHKQIHTK